MSFKPLLKIRPLRWALYQLAAWRVREKIKEISPLLRARDRILDVGAGNCVLCQQLRQSGYNVVPLDLKNLSFVDEIVPILYDGTVLPFRNDSFDVALLITVLHHASNPDAVLAEARRVARAIIVIEEIYETPIERYLTYMIDSLFNLEFFHHPRSNRTDAGWRTAFQTLGLDISAAGYSRSLGFLRRVTYALVRGYKRAELLPHESARP